jgi:hypothetical protein
MLSLDIVDSFTPGPCISDAVFVAAFAPSFRQNLRILQYPPHPANAFCASSDEVRISGAGGARMAGGGTDASATTAGSMRRTA